MGSRMYHYVLCFGGGILLLCMGCARPPTPVSYPPPHSASKEQIIHAIKKETFDFQSLKSLVRVKIAYPQGSKTKKQSFDGALLYKDSGELRFQGFGFMGRSLFDLSYKPNELAVYVPSSVTVYEGSPSPLTDFADADVFTIARRIIMGIGETYEMATFHFSQDVYSPRVDNGTGHQLLFTLNPNTLLIDKKYVLQNGETAAEIEYQNYERFGQKSFPTLVTVFLPPQQTTMSFDFESVVVNQPLPDTLFTLSLPSHVKHRPLTELGIGIPASPKT